jgi:hypothetical protein
MSLALILPVTVMTSLSFRGLPVVLEAQEDKAVAVATAGRICRKRLLFIWFLSRTEPVFGCCVSEHSSAGETSSDEHLAGSKAFTDNPVADYRNQGHGHAVPDRRIRKVERRLH